MTAPKIGVVGAPDIAHALSGLGFDIITADSFREAATAISNALKGEPFPLIVADSDMPVVVPWTTVTATKVTSLIVLDTQPGSGLLADRREVHLAVPATFNDLLAKLGYAGAPDPLGSKIISLDGSLVDELPAEPAPLPTPAPLPSVPAVEEASATADQDEPVPAPLFGASAVGAPLDLGLPGTAASGAPTFGPTVAAPDVITPGLGASPVIAPSQPAIAPVFGAPTVADDEPAPAEEAVEQPLDATPAPEVPFGGYITPAVDTAADEPEGVEAAAPVFPAPQQPAYTPPTAPPPAVASPARGASWDELINGTAPASAPAWEDAVPVAPAPPAVQHVPEPEVAPEPVVEPQPTRTRAGSRIGGKHGEVIFSCAGKGGVGKTSSAILLAECAAQQGLQAILIDANRGQADIRKYLRLGETALRSAYDAFQFGDPAAAVLKPSDFAHLRTAAKLDVPDFGIVLGPPSELAGSRYASASIYGDIIDYARSIADLVIVDTQIMEAPEERTDLWRDTIIPMLGGDAWLLAITDESSAGIDNLHERLQELRREGVSSARTLVLASQFLEFGNDEIDYFQKKFNGLGSFVGNTGVDDEFAVQLNLGKINSLSPSVRPAIDNILLRATNRADLFSPRELAPAGRSKASGGKFGFFGKKRGA